MQKFFFIGFFIFTLLAGTMSLNTSHAGNNLNDLQKANIIFNWLESQFPQILSPSPQQTHEVSSFYYRFYSDTDVVLATFIDYLWFIDHNGTVHDLGEVDFWVDYINGEEEPDPNLIGFGPIKVGETWVEHEYDDPNYVGMCHTFISKNEVGFQYEGMNEQVSIQYDFNGKRQNYESRDHYLGGDEIWFRTQEDGTGQRGDQMAVYLGQTNSNQIDVHRVWYSPDGRIDDEDEPGKLERYWKRMSCPH